MKLLEREGPLQELVAARNAAGEGNGSVVLVTGEPGIGKTALVSRFVEILGSDARVLWGTCDDLSIPRPLGPFRDLATSASPELQEILVSDAAPHRFHSMLLEELQRPPRPIVLVLEDVHWADEATLDAISVVGRRIAGLPAVLILTFRGGEIDPGHPVRVTLGAIRSSTSLYVQLAPLSYQAVALLAGDDADRIYAATGGNPFYVTEMVSVSSTGLPSSVASAVLGRASRLGEQSRRLVELVSMVPTRISTEILDRVTPNWLAAAEEPEHRQLLTLDLHHLSFRHELVRAAIQASVPAARRRKLHAEILTGLLETGADPADIVHHAQAAGDVEVMASHAVVAARRAAALESNREAYSHFRRAAEFVERLPLSERGALFEEFSVAAYTVDRLSDAFAAIEHAIQIYRELREESAVGRCTRILSRCYWFAGDGEASMKEAHEAVRILEPLGESVELARAYSGVSQLAMLSDRPEEALEWGSRAVELAEQLGDHAVKAHALVNIGSVRMQMDPSDMGTLLEAHGLADAVGDRHEAVRALLNLGYTAMDWIEPEVARRYTDMAITYAEDHQVDALLFYTRVVSAWLHLRRGNWDEADRICRAVLEADTSVAQLLARTVLAGLAIGRGDVDASERLADLANQADHTGELQRIVPVLQLETIWALTTGASVAEGRFERARDLMHAPVGGREAALAAWGAAAGISIPFQGKAPRAYAAMVERDWGAAAEAFRDAGWMFDGALMLSLLDDRGSLVEALSTARALGAGPLEKRTARRMRELGMSIPSRRRSTTLANPAGLTPRQLEVLELLAEGLTNTQIAKRLFVSSRTAEHHVEAILTKLGVSTRKEAARRYVEMGLTSK